MATDPTLNIGDKDRVVILGDEEKHTPVEGKKKLISKIWDDFDRSNDVATCRHCKKKFVAKTTSGTSHLKKHIENCFATKRKNQSLLLAKNVTDGTVKLKPYRFDQETSRRDMATMIIKHNYPFNMCDHEFFEIFCNGLNPNFKVVSRNTLRADVINLHKEEKKGLYNHLDDISSKVTCTTDIWTSDHSNIGYCCLTAHYITEDWELKKKILAYNFIAYPHDGETLFKFIFDLIMEWNLDKKIFSVVVDNATSNDSMVKYLKSWLVDKSLLPLGGELLHVRCSAHILNLIVQDGLAKIGGLLGKIRGIVKYLKKFAYANQKFENAINQCKLKGRRKVDLDVQNRWDSTFTMLDTALPLREAFDRLDQMDKNYKYNPSQKEWEVAAVVHGCLKHFYNATRHFSGTKFPTANVFFPDICSIQLQLMKWEQSEHDFLRHMAGPMKEKFEKYWEECSLVLAIVVVLDPRFKMDLEEYYYTQIHGHNAEKYIQRVRSTFVNLYMDYGGELLPSLDLWNSESVQKSSSINNALSDLINGTSSLARLAFMQMKNQNWINT